MNLIGDARRKARRRDANAVRVIQRRDVIHHAAQRDPRMVTICLQRNPSGDVASTVSRVSQPSDCSTNGRTSRANHSSASRFGLSGWWIAPEKACPPDQRRRAASAWIAPMADHRDVRDPGLAQLLRLQRVHRDDFLAERRIGKLVPDRRADAGWDRVCEQDLPASRSAAMASVSSTTSGRRPVTKASAAGLTRSRLCVRAIQITS